jgi:adenosylcobinamide-GDP ribazoletransferase
MIARHFIIATQFLTRLPVPAVQDFVPGDLSRAAPWFPFVGAVLGLSIAIAAWLGNNVDPWLGALLAVFCWIGMTGALHLDGLADLADALGAAHRDPSRFLVVLHDPHTGTFGVIAIVIAILAKLILTYLLLAPTQDFLLATMLIPAWARFAALLWSTLLPPLVAGQAERFAWGISKLAVLLWAATLLLLSAALVPALLAAPFAIAGWGLYLRARVGGISGDCLGAGIEVIEVSLLLVLVMLERSA